MLFGNVGAIDVADVRDGVVAGACVGAGVGVGVCVGAGNGACF